MHIKWYTVSLLSCVKNKWSYSRLRFPSFFVPFTFIYIILFIFLHFGIFTTTLTLTHSLIPFEQLGEIVVQRWATSDVSCTVGRFYALPIRVICIFRYFGYVIVEIIVTLFRIFRFFEDLTFTLIQIPMNLVWISTNFCYTLMHASFGFFLKHTISHD